MLHRVRSAAWRAVGLLCVSAGVVLGAVGPAAAAAPDATLTEISSDPFSNIDSQHRTEVEPDSFAAGDTVVAAFQVGRFVTSGGASSIGFATSLDGGTTWTQGILPSLTTYSAPAGAYARASDPSVAYDAAHGTWLVASLAMATPCSPDCRTAVVVSRSSDGLTWSAPVPVAPLGVGFAHDKEWVVCDSGATSARKGTCYTSFSDFTAGRRIVTSRSTDGGLTWSAPAGSNDPAATGLGAQPVVQPDGTLVVVFLAGNGESQIGAIRSTDGGATFGSMAVVSSSTRHVPTGMRGRALPSVEIDRAGVIYAAFDDCRFRPSCSPTTGANDIVLATSPDGVAWSGPTRVPIDDVSSGADHFIPGLAVDIRTSGASTRLALAYYTFPSASCTFETCELRVGFVSSNDGGATWGSPVELSPGAMALSWLPDTSQGRMVGDYISTSFVEGGYAVAVFPLARAAVSGFDQSTYAARIAVAPPPPPPPPPPPAASGSTPTPAAPPVAAPAPQPEPLTPPVPAVGIRPPARLVVASLRSSPRRPAAGGIFVVRMRVRIGTAGPSPAAASPLCRARIGGSSLRLVRRSFDRGSVTCAWRIPRTASGRSVLVSIGASRAGQAVRSVRAYLVAA